VSRLRQLTTVVRVAELRETVARSKVAAASAAVATARTVRCERLETLAGTRLDGADVAAGPVRLLDDGATHLVEVTLGGKEGA